MTNRDEQGVTGIQRAAQEAMLYHRVGAQDVVCDLCAHRCALGPGQRGLCGVRVNHEGRLYTLVSDRIVAMAVEPVERHSFYHVDPGSAALALATVGCTMRCRYCLNYTLSQLPKGNRGRVIGRRITPPEIVASARAHRCRSIVYTYTEPTVAFELMYETARLAHAQGVKNLLVTNGYLTDAALRLLAPYLAAAAVDLKGFDDHRYQQCCGARLEPVLETIRMLHQLGVWIEVTTLVVPGHNDFGRGTLSHGGVCRVAIAGYSLARRRLLPFLSDGAVRAHTAGDALSRLRNWARRRIAVRLLREHSGIVVRPHLLPSLPNNSHRALGLSHAAQSNRQWSVRRVRPGDSRRRSERGGFW